ncbi:MAG: sulfurtransferase [Pseudomonadota bacterium]
MNFYRKPFTAADISATIKVHFQQTDLIFIMNSPLISAQALHAQLGKTLVLDCRFNLTDKNQGLLQYAQGHIPGAYYFDLEQDLSSPVQLHGGRHPLPDMEILQAKLRRAGANQYSNIVVYDDSRMAYAARAWWLLRYMGHDNVQILDGGFKSWIELKGALDKREPANKAGNFTAKIQPGWILNRNDILQSEKIHLIDSREPRRFQGLEEPIDPIAGHIAGAVNYPWQEITTEQSFIKPDEWQKTHWESLPTKENLVVYCGSGVTACVNILSLHLAGIEAKLYPGSWSDWCSYLLEK